MSRGLPPPAGTCQTCQPCARFAAYRQLLAVARPGDAANRAVVERDPARVGAFEIGDPDVGALLSRGAHEGQSVASRRNRRSRIASGTLGRIGEALHLAARDRDRGQGRRLVLLGLHDDQRVTIRKPRDRRQRIAGFGRRGELGDLAFRAAIGRDHDIFHFALRRSAGTPACRRPATRPGATSFPSPCVSCLGVPEGTSRTKMCQVAGLRRLVTAIRRRACHRATATG